MRVAWAAWVQGLLGLAKAALFITLAVVIVQQVYFGPRRLEAARADVINRFEQERKTRVIALIHRQETRQRLRRARGEQHQHRRLRGGAARHPAHAGRPAHRRHPAHARRPGPGRRADRQGAVGAQGQGDGVRAALRHERRHHHRARRRRDRHGRQRGARARRPADRRHARGVDRAHGRDQGPAPT